MSLEEMKWKTWKYWIYGLSGGIINCLLYYFGIPFEYLVLMEFGFVDGYLLQLRKGDIEKD